MQVLPFYVHPSLVSLASQQYANTRSPNVFRVATLSNELLPFVMPLPVDFGGNYQLLVRSWGSNKIVARFGPAQFNHRILRTPTTRYIVFDGGPVGCLDLEPCGPYYIELLGRFSEVFWAIRELDGYIKFEMGNRRNVAGLPYDTTFKQWFYTPGILGNPTYDPFTVTARDNQGYAQVSYARLVPTWEYEFSAVSPSMQAVFNSFYILDSLSVSDELSRVELDGRQAKVTLRDKRSWDATVSLSLPDANQFDTKLCAASTFTVDPKFTGTANAEVCDTPALMESVSAACDSLFDGVSVTCDPVDLAKFNVKIIAK